MLLCYFPILSAQPHPLGGSAFITFPIRAYLCPFMVRKKARIAPRLELIFGNVPPDYTVYVLLEVVPPRPVQLVWKNSPRGLSTRS